MTTIKDYSPEDLFERNYIRVYDYQGGLIDHVQKKLEDPELTLEAKDKLLSSIEKMMGKSSTSRELVGSATYIYWLYITGALEFVGIHELTPTQVKNIEGLKYQACKYMNQQFKQDLENRDKEILDILKKYGSKYYKTVEEMKSNKFYWENLENVKKDIHK